MTLYWIGFFLPDFYSNNKTTLTTESVNKTLPYVGKEYTLSFEVLVSKHEPGYQSIIQLTQGSPNQYGDRTPAVFINRVGTLTIATALDGYWNHVYASSLVLPTNQWVRVDISQTLSLGKVQGIGHTYCLRFSYLNLFIKCEPVCNDLWVSIGLKSKSMGIWTTV